MSRDTRMRAEAIAIKNREDRKREKRSRKANVVPVSHYSPHVKSDLYNYLFPIDGTVKSVTILIEDGAMEVEMPIAIKYVCGNTTIDKTDVLFLGDNYIDLNIDGKVGGRLSFTLVDFKKYIKTFSKIWLSFKIETQ